MKITRSGSQPSATGSADWFTGTVLFGVGRVQREGGPVEEIRPGDIVWFEPGEKHWHGASPTAAMQHLAVAEALNGKVVEWMEKVTDEEYQHVR